MDMLKAARLINGKIKELEELKLELHTLSIDKSMKEGRYEKEIARTIMRLKMGEVFTLDGAEIKDPPASYTINIAKGICWKEKHEADMADLSLRNQLKIIDTTIAQLNGYQSINKHLAEIENE